MFESATYFVPYNASKLKKESFLILKQWKTDAAKNIFRVGWAANHQGNDGITDKVTRQIVVT